MNEEKYIEVQGGLGNQMFQYALYITLKQMGYEVYIDDDKLVRYGNQHNGLELHKAFKISYKKMTLFRKLKKIWWIIHDYALKMMRVEKNRNVLIDKEPTLMKEILDKNIHYLRGYWQEPSYWQNINEYIREVFTFNDVLVNKKNLLFLNEITNNNSVAIHIRRGDYLWAENVDKRMNICNLEYYKKGIEYFVNKFDKCKFYIFTDDPKWVEANFGFVKYTLVDWNKGEDSFFDMYLMSKCKHNIIANSTFSWWAAYLNNNSNKIVICPNRWYSDKDSNLILKEWIKVDSVA